MTLKVVYDKEVNILTLSTGEEGFTSTSLPDFWHIVLDLVSMESRYVVAVELAGASAFLPLGKRDYDDLKDQLVLGSVMEDAHIETNGDIQTLWVPYKDDPDSFMDPVGVIICNASRHLGQIVS